MIAGVSLRVVQVALGQSTITTTERYAHLEPGNGDAIVAAFSNKADNGNPTATEGDGLDGAPAMH